MIRGSKHLTGKDVTREVRGESWKEGQGEEAERGEGGEESGEVEGGREFKEGVGRVNKEVKEEERCI